MAEEVGGKAKRYSHHKRKPHRSVESRNDVYVSRSSNFKMQLERCEALLEKEFDEIVIHGLGAAVNRAIHLALQLEERGEGKRAISASTSTVELVDDFEAEDEDGYSYSEKRNNSSIAIRVYTLPEAAESKSVVEKVPKGVIADGRSGGLAEVLSVETKFSKKTKRLKSSKDRS
eukprot:m.28834 g.28834  ORF g.28834 m.28834 type:complete len:174 (+) comp31064_c0_seq1:17-538(+)